MLDNLHHEKKPSKNQPPPPKKNKPPEKELARRKLYWNGLMPSSFFGRISNKEQFMEYIERSIRLLGISH